MRSGDFPKGQENCLTTMAALDLAEGFKLGDRVLVFVKPNRESHAPGAYEATINL